ncbi:MAG: hypothetical protein ACYSU1_01430 [Planctomycetota bacterium]|jgi:hypothetical protein
MKKLRPIFLLPFLLLASCAAPLVLAGMGAAVGIWTYDDFQKDRGEMIVRASAEHAFATAKSAVQARPGATEITQVPGSMRIEFEEDKADVVVQIMLMPETPEFATLRVYAAEMAIRGRAELAREVAEDIGAKLR